jgi:c-di-GMP-binding flagellar brake protein YcgR
MNFINRREFPRIEVDLACRLESCRDWTRSWSGRTGNISRTGILMTCFADGLSAPAVGETVSVEIQLPPHHRFGPKCIHCQASVVRVLERGAEFTVALSANQMQFRSIGERLPVSAWSQPALTQ